MKNKKIVFGILGIVVLVIVAMNFVWKSSNAKEETKSKPINMEIAMDFHLEDQSGKTHSLSRYQGKTVFLNFWATWCPNCIHEMPSIQELYSEYGKNEEEVVILTMVNPSSKEYSNNSDIEIEELKKFVAGKQYDFPVLMDITGEVFHKYQIQAFPTTYMITKDGKIRGFIMGALSKKDMQTIIENTEAGK